MTGLRHHLRNDHSLLLLVLPSRCIYSKHVGAQRLEALFTALGFRLLERKETPRLTFYTLQRGAYNCSERSEREGNSTRGKEEDAWRQETRLALKKNLSSELTTHFSSDFSYARAFCLCLEASWWL